MAGKDRRLPPVAGPLMGISVTADDLPFARLVTRPFVSDLTSGVLSQNPGSVGLPRLATVMPSDFAAPSETAGAAASLRWAAVVVSSASWVLAAAGGLGAAVRTGSAGSAATSACVAAGNAAAACASAAAAATRCAGVFASSGWREPSCAQAVTASDTVTAMRGFAIRVIHHLYSSFCTAPTPSNQACSDHQPPIPLMA